MDPYLAFLFTVAVLVILASITLQERRRRKAPGSRPGGVERLLPALFLMSLAMTEFVRLLVEGTLASIPLIALGLVGTLAVIYLAYRAARRSDTNVG
jgi:ABC-type antimicrobial peptide transport system permease subunit